MQIRKTSLFTLSLVIAAACSRTSPDTSPPNPVSTDLPATHSAPDDPAAIAVAAMPDTAEVKAPPEHLTNDDEIFGVLHEMNDQAIEQVDVAAKGLVSQQVRDFAALMLAEHGAVRQRAEETRESLGLRRSDSKLADQVEEISEEKLDVLKKVDKGEQYDRAYINIAVDSHRMWLDYVDTKLLPRAQMPKLRLELDNFRSMLERHYNLAKQIQASMTPQS